MAAIAQEPPFARRVRLTDAGRKLALPLIVLGGAATFYVLGLPVDRPITFPDEAVYADLARHFGADGGFKVAGAPFPALTFGPLYSVLLIPIFKLAHTPEDAYSAARALNAVLFASAAVPIWLVARRSVTNRAALVISAAGIALPASIYTTKLQTESLAYPVMLWSIVAALAVVSRPGRRRQFGLLSLLLAAPLVRFQLLALGPALAVGCLACVPGRLRERISRLRTLLIGVGTTVVGIGVLLVVTSRGAGPQGTHGSNFHTLSIWSFAKSFIGSIGVLDLYTGILPFAVFALFLVRGGAVAHQSWAGGEARRLALLTAWSGIGLALIGSLYLAAIPASFRPPAPTDRFTFYVVPLILILFARWIEQGTPGARLMRWIVPAAASLPLVVVAMTIDGHGAVENSSYLALMPWIFLRNLFSGPWWLIALGAYCSLCVARGMRRHACPDPLIRPVVAVVAVTSVCAFIFVVSGAHGARRLAPPPGWLDAHSDSAVAAIWEGHPTRQQSFALWETDAMNTNLVRVFYVTDPDPLGAQFERKIERRSNGVLLDHGRQLSYRYVLTSSHTRFAGRLLATSRGLSLYRAQLPLRLIDDLGVAH
jgi:hypothetical protein